MRIIRFAAAGFAAAFLISGVASAATLSMPAAPTAPAFHTVADMQMMVAHSYAHLREKPSTSSKILATLNHGTKVDVIEKGGKWTHVKANNMDGYISTNLLK
jgi:uncharacterized protein YgiM (DUF1202 family)